MSSVSPDPSPDRLKSPIDSAEDEVARIRNEMSLIKPGLTANTSHVRYAYLCRRLNSIQSHIRSIPPELLSIVFQHASPSLSYFGKDHEDRRLFHLVLRSVSSNWYNVVQSTPELWNCIYSNKTTTGKHFEMYFKLCLDNSGNLPLTIHLGSFLESPTTVLELQIPSPLENMVLFNAHRIQDLRLYRPPTRWLMLLLPKMSQLSALDVRWRKSDYDIDPDLNLQIPSSANLRRLSICAPIRDLRVESPKMSITHLVFHHVPIDICIGLFMECQNLIEFHSVSPAHPMRNTKRTISPYPLVYQHLIALTWHLLDSSEFAYWTKFPLSHIRVPALKSLSWLNISNFHQFLDAPFFFQRLPKSLNEITFMGMYLDVDVSTPIWLDYTRHDADIQILRVHHCTDSFLNKVFSKLFKKVTSSNELVVPFPKLIQCHSLTARDNGRNQRMSSKIGENLLLLLEERMGLIDQFTFWTTGYDLAWSKEIWLHLKKIQDSSFNLIIGEHGKCVDISSKCNML